MWCVFIKNLHEPVYMVDMFPVVDTCTIPYAHVLYMGCGKGRSLNGEPMYKGSRRGWGGIRTREHIDYGRLWM